MEILQLKLEEGRGGVGVKMLTLEHRRDHYNLPFFYKSVKFF